MKLAVLITRSPTYRLYAPVIEAALARGWDVECWHDVAQPQTGSKAYQFPSLDSVPAFRNGRPIVRGCRGPAELVEWLGEMRADALLWTGTAQAAGLPLPERRPMLIAHQYLLDTFCGPGPANLLSNDVIAFYSRWWVEWAGEYFELEGQIEDRREYVREAEQRAAFVGLTQMDVAPQLDPEDVRRRWNIPLRQPVVVLLPFPQGTGRATFWPRRICGEPSRLKQAAAVLAERRFEYVPDVWHGWNDLNVVKALRRFCDRSGAYLLVKSREKTPIPGYLRQLADGCVYDERHYPATVLEALSIASLAVSYLSGAVLEAASLGVPHLCVTFEAKDYIGENSAYYSRFYSAREGGPFQFRGVSTAWTIPETLGELPRRTLADFTMDAEARARYVERFLTHDTGDGGRRTIAAIEGAATARAS